MLRRVILAAALLGPVALAAPTQDTRPAQEAKVDARIEVLTPTVAKVADLRLAVEVTNPAASPVEIDATFFPLTSVVLEVVDAGGKPVPKLPPPVPPADPTAGRRPLDAGESIRLEYRGGELIGLPLAPGAYRVRFRVPQPSGALESEWGTFTVQ